MLFIIKKKIKLLFTKIIQHFFLRRFSKLNVSNVSNYFFTYVCEQYRNIYKFYKFPN